MINNIHGIFSRVASNRDYAPSAYPTTRAEAALTHPATLLALATLLVNDLIFKSMWPGSWITGKLSDLAWVIFAPPLLALPLTFLSRRNQTAQKAAWSTAYIGLPLLYAAYNTIEPLHDVIMDGFSLVRGTPGGSPFDPTDSIVIPFAMATAIWVWRTAQVNNAATKVKLGLFIAVLASVASVATTVDEDPTGVSVLSQDESGNIVAKDLRRNWGEFFRSSDGGFTWEQSRRDHATEEAIDWNFPTADAPEGTYSLEGPDVVLTADGVARTIHSTTNINRNADYRIFALATDSIGGDFRAVTHLPTDIHFDAGSGNLIIAMGLQGVLVRTPDGKWQRIGVGRYNPIDYSIANRARLLIFGEDLGWLFMSLIIASLGFALTASTLPLVPENRRYVKAIPAGAAATVLIVGVAVFGTGPVLQSLGLSTAVGEIVGVLSIPFSVFVFIALMVIVAKTFGIPYGATVRSVLALILLFASAVPLFFYTEVSSTLGEWAFVRGSAAIVVGLIALIFLVIAFVKTRSFRVLLATILSAIGMTLAANFVFLIWLSGFIDLLPAKIASVLLVLSIAFMLFDYVRRKSGERPTTPSDQQPTGQVKRRQPVYPVRLSKNEHENRVNPCPTTPSTTPPSTSQTKPHS